MLRRVLRFVSFLLAISFVLIPFAGCGRKDPYFDVNTEKVFRFTLSGQTPDEVVIHSLDLYKVERKEYGKNAIPKYFYHITYTCFSHVTEEWEDLDLVYFGTGIVSRHFSFAWDDFGDMEKDRDEYYDAVANGKHKAFSQKEIQKYVDAYYAANEKTEGAPQGGTQ